MSRKAGSADPAITRDTAESLANAGRLKQMRMVAGLIRKSNPKAIPIIVGSGLGILVVLVIVGLLTGLAAFLIPLGVLLGLLAATILFGRYAQAAQYAAIEGQPGAARQLALAHRFGRLRERDLFRHGGSGFELSRVRPAGASRGTCRCRASPA